MTSLYQRFLAVIGMALALSGGQACAAAPAGDGFGRLPPVEDPAYSRYQRQSIYVPVRDGTRLAVDIYRPMTPAGVEEKPLPVIFYYARYWRARQLPDGSISTNLGVLMKGQSIGALTSRDSSGRLLFWDTGRESIPEIMRHGYIFVRAEGRGTGASEGVRLTDYAPEEARDGADLVAWIADQPWSNGKVGMMGGSYPGITQLMVAAEAPPALKAIFPAAPALDFYRLMSGGTGVLHKGIVGFQAAQARSDGLDVEAPVAAKVVPVDDDPDGVRLREILDARVANTPPDSALRALHGLSPEFAGTVQALAQAWELTSLAEASATFLDAATLMDRQRPDANLQAKALAGLHLFRDTEVFSEPDTTGMVSPHLKLPALKAAKVPTYVWSGWYDMDTVGATQLFQNLDGPKKMTIGPWSHGPNEDNGSQRSPLIHAEARARELLTAEATRWFDHWLKGRDNGVMNDPPVHYGYKASGAIRWAGAEQWPAPDARAETFHLLGGAGEGGLATTPGAAAEMSFTVDYLATMGPQSRYHDSFSGAPEMAYPDLAAHAQKGLTFTTTPLADDLVVVGHPVITLLARSTAADGDVFVYLEDVGPEGTSYVTEAVIRASHRTLASAPYDVMGLPFSESSRAAVAATRPFNAGPVRLVADLQPTAYRFKAGHRIRVVVTGADADNYITPPILPEPEITLSVGGRSGSAIVLPVLAEAGAK
ncbi:CocE/NonD family hydrolase [Phenylobacterium sp.]|uniref:CocE/NonD family hydrolase n=1 Tax=Phenylobacterium sp. TaxID=1871053 RepID=UPI00272FD81E|nr:CocE/NonD family hydrolase [Phenylobacterium sp.]MDP1618070.1 CocE/NonD family hydrolase [Phenylobacterium sp.]